MTKLKHFFQHLLVVLAVFLLISRFITSVEAAWPQVLLVENNWLRFNSSPQPTPTPTPKPTPTPEPSPTPTPEPTPIPTPTPTPKPNLPTPDINLVMSNGVITGRSIKVEQDFLSEAWLGTGDAVSTQTLITAKTSPEIPHTTVTWDLEPSQRDFWQLSFNYRFTVESGALPSFGEPAVRVSMCGETAWILQVEQSSEEWREIMISRSLCGETLPDRITWELIGGDAANLQLQLAEVALDKVSVWDTDTVEFVSSPSAKLRYSNHNSGNEGPSPLAFNPTVFSDTLHFEVVALDEQEEVLATENFTLGKELITPGYPIIGQITREENGQLVFPAGGSGRGDTEYAMFDLRIAAVAADLKTNFDALPRVTFEQSHLLNHLGTWVYAPMYGETLLVTEPITDEDFYLGMRVRGSAWQAGHLSAIWRCQGNVCSEHILPHEYLTPVLKTIATDELQLNLFNSNQETIDLSDWEIWSGTEWQATISQLNANLWRSPTEWGATIIPPGNGLLINLKNIDPVNGQLTLYNQFSQKMIEIDYHRESDEFGEEKYFLQLNYT